MNAPDVTKPDQPPEGMPPSRLPPYSVLIFGAFVLMAVAVMYVWSHIHMTALEYQVAAELNRKEMILEEQRRLKVELATLKAPHRIEAIARDKLKMTAPTLNQVVTLKTQGQTP